MIRTPAMFAVCFGLVTTVQPTYGMDDDSDHGIQSSYTTDPDYIFAQHFLAFVANKITNGEDSSVPLNAPTASHIFNNLRALERYKGYGYAAKTLTEWLEQVSRQEGLDATSKAYIKDQINRILDKETFSKKQIQAILICFLDTYDENFKILSEQQKKSFSLRNLVLRLMEVCNTPASVTQRWGMALGSQYPGGVGAVLRPSSVPFVTSYMGGVFAGVFISLGVEASTTVTQTSFTYLGALYGYPVIGALAVTGFYNGIRWFLFKKDEQVIKNAINTAPATHENDSEEVLLEQ